VADSRDMPEAARDVWAVTDQLDIDALAKICAALGQAARLNGAFPLPATVSPRQAFEQMCHTVPLCRAHAVRWLFCILVVLMKLLCSNHGHAISTLIALLA
jgi:hypothetical protein